MACSPVRAVSILWAYLLLIALVTASEETPREYEDREDNWYFNFVTRPDIQAPKFHVHIHDADAIAPGYWFVSPYNHLNKRYQGFPWEGPYIYNGSGELIWAGPPGLNYYNAHDFKLSNLNGEDHLTAIYPLENAGLFWNNRYEIVKKVTWTPSWESANMHEFHIIENGTRALTTTREGHRLLSLEESKTMGYDGECMVRADGIEELDISVDPPKLLFKWIGIEHVPLKDTAPHMKQDKVNEMCAGNWDIHHINSVDKFANGDYLVSFKVLNTVFRVSHQDGSIVWRLGGPHSDFSVPHNVHFESQHIPRIVSESSSQIKLSIFDNAGGKLARGILVELDLHSMSATLVQEAPHPFEERMNSRGSTQLLDNGNLFSCWAEWSRITEHDTNGKQVLFAHTKANKGEMPTYRGFKFQWVGLPSEPPYVYSAAFALGLDRKRIITSTFVSWNGATEVEEYKLYESNTDETQWKLLNKTEKRGFETNMQYEGFAEYVLVEAIGGNGRTLGWSRLVHTIPPVQGLPDEEKAVEWSKAPADFPVEDCKPLDLGGASHGDSSFRELRIDNISTNPIATYIAGIFTAAGMFVGLRVAKWTWRRRIGTKYRPLDAKGYGHLLEDKYHDTELDDNVSVKISSS